jgi:hypothetical protein
MPSFRGTLRHRFVVLWRHGHERRTPPSLEVISKQAAAESVEFKLDQKCLERLVVETLHGEIIQLQGDRCITDDGGKLAGEPC